MATDRAMICRKCRAREAHDHTDDVRDGGGLYRYAQAFCAACVEELLPYVEARRDVPARLVQACRIVEALEELDRDADDLDDLEAAERSVA